MPPQTYVSTKVTVSVWSAIKVYVPSWVVYPSFATLQVISVPSSAVNVVTFSPLIVTVASAGVAEIVKVY